MATTSTDTLQISGAAFESLTAGNTVDLVLMTGGTTGNLTLVDDNNVLVQIIPLAD
jgi:hypothetical protein